MAAVNDTVFCLLSERDMNSCPSVLAHLNVSFLEPVGSPKRNIFLVLSVAKLNLACNFDCLEKSWPNYPYFCREEARPGNPDTPPCSAEFHLCLAEWRSATIGSGTRIIPFLWRTQPVFGCYCSHFPGFGYVKRDACDQLWLLVRYPVVSLSSWSHRNYGKFVLVGEQ